MTERWDLYTADRQPTGETVLRGELLPAGRYHLAIHVCVFDREGRMLIQQRQPFKEDWSGYWDVTVGGSAVAGETSSQAAERELAEEIGIAIDFTGARPALTVDFDAGFDDWYLVERDVDIGQCVLQPEEVRAVRWAALPEILSLVDAGQFIPYHRSFLETLFTMRRRRGAHQYKEETI